jgi:hypothetical protein
VTGLAGVLVLPIVLLVPGFALLRAIVPRGGERDAVLTVGMSAALSLAFYILAALVMHALSLEYSRENTALVTVAGVVLCSAVAFVRRGEETGKRRLPSVPAALTGVAFCAALAAAAVLAVQLERHLPKGAPEPWVELSAENPLASADGPTEVPPGEPFVVPLRVDTSGGSPATYRLTARVDRESPRAAASQRLAPGATWRTSVASVVPADGRLHRVSFTLEADNGRAPLELVLYARGAQP